MRIYRWQVADFLIRFIVICFPGSNALMLANAGW